MIPVRDMMVKPARPGEIVRYPGDAQRVLPAEGAEVPDADNYWHRRLRDGSVVRVVEPTGREPVTPLTTR